MSIFTIQVYICGKKTQLFDDFEYLFKSQNFYLFFYPYSVHRHEAKGIYNFA
jgi:hypothetical protein